MIPNRTRPRKGNFPRIRQRYRLLHDKGAPAPPKSRASECRWPRVQHANPTSRLRARRPRPANAGALAQPGKSRSPARKAATGQARGGEGCDEPQPPVARLPWVMISSFALSSAHGEGGHDLAAAQPKPEAHDGEQYYARSTAGAIKERVESRLAPVPLNSPPTA